MKIAISLLLISCLFLGCAKDLARDNPLDPLNTSLNVTGSLSGRITDKDNPAVGVANATVKLLNYSDQSQVGSPATSDINGNFVFSNVKAGTYYIQFSAKWYNTHTSQVYTLTPNMNNTFNQTLQANQLIFDNFSSYPTGSFTTGTIWEVNTGTGSTTIQYDFGYKICRFCAPASTTTEIQTVIPGGRQGLWVTAKIKPLNTTSQASVIIKDYLNNPVAKIYITSSGSLSTKYNTTTGGTYTLTSPTPNYYYYLEMKIDNLSNSGYFAIYNSSRIILQSNNITVYPTPGTYPALQTVLISNETYTGATEFYLSEVRIIGN
jgi:hypothetical protein